MLGIGVLVVMMFSAGDEGPRRFGRVILLAGLVGGGIGNFLWSAVLGKKSASAQDDDVPKLADDDDAGR